MEGISHQGQRPNCHSNAEFQDKERGINGQHDRYPGCL
jgi:hypothetical protein